MQIDGVPVLPAILDNERQIKALTKIVDRLIQIVPPGSIDQQFLNKCHEESWEEMAQKYPAIVRRK